MRNLEKRVFNTYYTSTDGSLGYYLNEISKYKILPDYETKKEILKAQKGDKRASDKVVNSNQRFIFSIAKRFCNGDKDLLKDLIDLVYETYCKLISWPISHFSLANLLGVRKLFRI